MPLNYEAYDEQDVQIFNGAGKRDFINELLDHIHFTGYIDDTLVTEEEIRSLNKEALKRVGITIYTTPY